MMNQPSLNQDKNLLHTQNDGKDFFFIYLWQLFRITDHLITHLWNKIQNLSITKINEQNGTTTNDTQHIIWTPETKQSATKKIEIRNQQLIAYRTTTTKMSHKWTEKLEKKYQHQQQIE